MRERAELLQAQEAENKHREKEMEDYKRAREAWDRRRRGLESETTRLKDELKQSQEMLEEMETEHNVCIELGK